VKTSILFLNIQCLRNKIQELEVILEINKFDILCFEEHWLVESEANCFRVGSYSTAEYFARKNHIHGELIEFPSWKWLESRHNRIKNSDSSTKTAWHMDDGCVYSGLKSLPLPKRPCVEVFRSCINGRRIINRMKHFKLQVDSMSGLFNRASLSAPHLQPIRLSYRHSLISSSAHFMCQAAFVKL
jgi:hypothetical protein